MEKEYEELRQTVDLEVVEKLAETHELEKISDQKLKMLHSNKRDMQNAIDGLNKQMVIAVNVEMDGTRLNSIATYNK